MVKFVTNIKKYNNIKILKYSKFVYHTDGSLNLRKMLKPQISSPKISQNADV